MTNDLVEKVAQEISRHDKYRVPSDSEKPASYEYFMPFARAALSSIEEAGWCVVRKEQTDELLARQKKFQDDIIDRSRLDEAAILSARPRITGETT